MLVHPGRTFDITNLHNVQRNPNWN